MGKDPHVMGKELGVNISLVRGPNFAGKGAPNFAGKDPKLRGQGPKISRARVHFRGSFHRPNLAEGSAI